MRKGLGAGKGQCGWSVVREVGKVMGYLLIAHGAEFAFH